MNYTKLGLILKNARESSGFTQKEIADFLKVTPQNVSSWERGKSKIDIDTFATLCLKYGLPFASTLDSLSPKNESSFYHQQKSDPLKELGKQYKLDTLDQSIIKNYIQLSPAQREVIKQYLYNIVDDVLSDENYESFREGYLDSHPVQMAASNGDTSGLEEIIAQFEAADNIHLDSKKDTKK